MGKRKNYTVLEAVFDVLDEMPENKKVRGYEICNSVRHKMLIHSTGVRPMDGTILRRVRELRDLFCLNVSHGGGISEYIKQGQEEKKGA